MSKSLEVTITGKDDLTEKARAAQKSLNELRRETDAIVSGFTGGLIGGGLASTVLAAANVVRGVLKEAQQLVNEARRLGVDTLDLGRAKLLGLATGEEGIASASIVSARQARAEALAGDPTFTKAFRDLGMTIESIQKLNPLELQKAVIEAFRQGPRQRDQREALRDIFGDQAGSSMESLAAGGFFSGGRLEQTLKGIASWLSQSPVGLVSLPLIPGKSLGARAADLLAGFREPMEPLSQFGRGDEERLKMMREINAQRSAEIARSQLSTEEQINKAVEERARIQKLIDSEVNPVARERLIMRQLGVEAEIAALQRQSENDLPAGQAASMAIRRASDPLRSVGFDLSRISSGGPNYPQQLVQLGQKQVQQLEGVRTELRKFNE